MAGVDQSFQGEAFPAEGYHRRVPAAGATARSGEDGARERRGRRRGDTRAPDALRRDQRASSARSCRRTRWTRCSTSRPRCRTKSRRPTRWDLDSQLELAMDALRLPPPDADVSTLSGGERRRVALCRLLLQVARPAAARRADEPSRRRVGRLARALPQGVPGHGRRGHARPLLPRQRRRLDPRARSRRRHSLGGQLLVLAGAEAEASRGRGEDGEHAPAHAAARARVDPAVAARAPGQGQGAPERLRAAARRGDRAEGRATIEIYIPPGPRLGDIVVEAQRPDARATATAC